MFIVNVEGAIRRSDQRYLICTRSAQEAHAAGKLSLIGGKVEAEGAQTDILETTLRRELQEEVGLEVGELVYIESNAFIADDGEAVINIVFLCQYIGGEPMIAAPEEIAGWQWLTAEQIFDHPETPPWLRQSIEKILEGDSR